MHWCGRPVRPSGLMPNRHDGPTSSRGPGLGPGLCPDRLTSGRRGPRRRGVTAPETRTREGATREARPIRPRESRRRRSPRHRVRVDPFHPRRGGAHGPPPGPPARIGADRRFSRPGRPAGQDRAWRSLAPAAGSARLAACQPVQGAGEGPPAPPTGRLQPQPSAALRRTRMTRIRRTGSTVGFSLSGGPAPAAGRRAPRCRCVWAPSWQPPPPVFLPSQVRPPPPFQSWRDARHAQGAKTMLASAGCHTFSPPTCLRHLVIEASGTRPSVSPADSPLFERAKLARDSPDHVAPAGEVAVTRPQRGCRGPLP